MAAGMTARTIRRAPGTGSLRRRNDGRWEARVTVAYRTQRCFYGETPEEAERKGAAFMAERGSADVIPLTAPKRVREGLTPTQRFSVLERCGFACAYCGRRAPDVELTVDHIIPKSRGGTDDDANLTAACRECNVGKGNRVMVRSGSIGLPAPAEVA